MPTAKPRVTITMDTEQLCKIEEYRFNHRCKNQTQAILSLIEAGFSTLESSISSASPKDTLSVDEKSLVEEYRKLDNHGKEIVDLVLEKESARCKSVASSHLTPIAAHNDNEEDEQVHLMREDIDEL